MRVQEGWHRALDAQMDCHKFYLSEDGKVIAGTFFLHAMDIDLDAASRQDLVYSLETTNDLVTTLWRADTMFVTSDMLQVLLQAAHDLPDEACFDEKILITPIGFCLLEEPIVGEDRNGYVVHVHGMAWNVIPRGDDVYVVVYFLTDMADNEDELNQLDRIAARESGTPLPPYALTHFLPIRSGEAMHAFRHPEVRGNELVVAMVRLFTAMHLVAHQSIGEPMQMRANRATRKRAISWDRDNERYITLITLRRKSVKKDGEPAEVERTHRWIVRGHWRRQWYPSLKRHDWKYIYEHIKGPEDKPLLISERRVFNFRR